VTLTHEKPTEEIRELAALYALGALTQHEADSFEAHMREGCPVCEAECLKYKHIAAEIGLGAGEAPAPGYIRELILARIARETPEQDTPEPPVAAPELPVAAPEPSAPAPRAEPAPSPKPVLGHIPARRPSIVPWVLAALFAVIAGLVFFAYRSEQSDNKQLRGEIASVRTDLSDLEKLYEIQKGRRGELEQIIATVSKPETRILHLAGLAPAPASSGAILWDVLENKCLVFGFMPPAPQGKAYQLWFLTPSAKIPSGTLKPDPSGRIYEWFPIPGDVSSLTMVLTLEPESGSQVPTLPYYAIGRND